MPSLGNTNTFTGTNNLELSGQFQTSGASGTASRTITSNITTGALILSNAAINIGLNSATSATLTFNGMVVDADHVKGDVDFGGQGGATFSGTRKK